MEYNKNTEYGKTECFRCLLSPDREEAAIFIGMNKVISRALDVDSSSIYPCKVLNRFACPYDKKMIAGSEEGEGYQETSLAKSLMWIFSFIYQSLLLQ